MNILHFGPVNWHNIGGLHVSIPALVDAQNRIDGVNAALAITVPRSGQAPALDFSVFDRRITVDQRGRLNLPAPFDRPDMAVFHSTYIPRHAVIAAKLRKARIPYIICPRGGMTRWAHRFRWWKKRVADLLFFKRMVAGAAALNCLTEGEAEASREWRRPMFIAGNGTTLPPALRLASPGTTAGRRLLFIGRLHIQYKGLDMLLTACDLVREELLQTETTIELHGPDCDGSTKALRRQIAALQLEEFVTLHGPALGEAKASLLAASDVFLHPSRSEGHPMAVLEALAYGLPCLLTPVTNVADEVADAGAGWQVEPTPEGIAAGLRQVLHAEDDALRQAGAAARQLAAENYCWDKTAARCVEAYRRCAA